MEAAPHVQALAQVLAERMLNSVVQGVAIALFGWILLRLLGRQNSSTRFAVWFCALIAIAALPFFASAGLNLTAGNASALSSATRSVIWLPGRWALDIFLLWAVIASAGLVRIGFGFWRLCKLRRSCTEIPPLFLVSLWRSNFKEFGLCAALPFGPSIKCVLQTPFGFWSPLSVIPPLG